MRMPLSVVDALKRQLHRLYTKYASTEDSSIAALCGFPVYSALTEGPYQVVFTHREFTRKLELKFIEFTR